MVSAADEAGEDPRPYAPGREFADLVHQVLVMEKRFTVAAVAEAFGARLRHLFVRVSPNG